MGEKLALSEPGENGAWDHLCDLVAQALELAPEQRAGYLEQACKDAGLRAEAASLVAAAGRGNASRLLDGGPPVLTGLMDEDAVSDSPWNGRRLGPYEVVGELGRGGMGVVLLARRADELYQRQVAIKVILSSLDAEDFVRRFRRETRILARLHHPAIVSLLDAGTTPEQHQPYLVMEYIDGVPIHQYVEWERLSFRDVLKLVVKLCDALSHAHTQGVVHRDVKPGNVLVDAAGEPKLLDFGIARLLDAAPGNTDQTLTAFRALTPTYASPEQISGGEATAKSDIYSVGVLLYVLLTGRPPFRLAGLTATEIERILQAGQAPLPSRAGSNRFSPHEVASLDGVIGRAMHPQMTLRYNSIDDLKAELLRVIDHQRPRASARRYLAARWWRRRRKAVAASTLSAAALGCVMAVGVWLHRHERQAPPPPQAGRLSIAVVPLSVNSGNATHAAWRTIAAQEALDADLAAGDQIRVISPQAVAQAARELHLNPAQELSPSDRNRLENALGADYLLEERTEETSPGSGLHGSGLHGSGLHGSGLRDSGLRIDVSLHRAGTGGQVAQQSEEAPTADLEQAAQRLAVGMARVLPLKHTLATPPSLLPRSPLAVRDYAEGLEHLQSLEAVAARDSFERAASADPGSPLIHAALARTWDMLGYRRSATDEAGQAIALSAGLPARSKLVVNAQADEIRHQWPDAIAAYSTLHDYDPDDLDYVLGLARSQLAANQGDVALKTLHAAEAMPSLLGSDPRLELLAANAEETMGRHADSLKHVDQVFAAAQERGAKQLLAQAESARAAALESVGKLDLGMAAARDAQTLFAAAGDENGEAVSLLETGNFLEDHAQFAEARTCYQRAEDIFTRTGDEAHRARAENDLGIVADDVGDLQEALAHYTSALATLRRVEDTQRIPLELNNIGIIQKELSQVEAAKHSFTEALSLLEKQHDKRRVAQEYDNLGFILIQQGQLDAAQKDFEQAFSIYSGTGQLEGTIYAIDGMGHVAWNRGRLAEAHAHYQDAIRIARQIPEPKHLATTLRLDAHLLHDAGDEANARRELKEAEDLREAHHEPVALAEARLSAIIFDLDEGRSIEPAKRFQELLDLFTSKREEEDIAEIQLAWAKSLLIEGKTGDAAEHFRVAEEVVRRLHNPDIRDSYVIAAARLAAKEGRAKSAETLLRRALNAARRNGNMPAQMNFHSELAQLAAARQDRRSQAEMKQYSAESRRYGFLRVAGHIEKLCAGAHQG